MDATTGEVIESAHVFIPNTEFGTLTDSKGEFSISNIPEGSIEIFFSFIGYGPEKKILTLPTVSDRSSHLKIPLTPSSTTLDQVVVRGKKSNSRKRNLKQFKSAILGTTSFASKCEIINPEVILLSKQGNDLSAVATDLIKIRNLATGYEVNFLLEHFQKTGKKLTYSGKPFFIPLTSENEKQQKKWDKNRTRAYLGSQRHFLSSLINGTAEKEGFRIYQSYQGTDGSLKEGFRISPGKLISKTNKPGIYQLNFKQFLKVVYLKEKDRISVDNNDGLGNAAVSLGRKGEKDIIEQTGRDGASTASPQISYLFARKSNILFDEYGLLKEPDLLVSYNYWTYEGLADMVPIDPGQQNRSIEIQPSSGKKGFQFSDLLIPESEIFDGGPPKDGIPAIDRPRFVEAGNATFLKENDSVLGVVIGGKARAYPIKILDFHEIVNDRMLDQYLTVTWCPLCGSGIVFSHGEKQRSFGVSGLLYNSDVLLYDRETESLWSQIMGQAVSGELSGSKLEIYPSEITTWKRWRKKFPATEVLSTKTGFSRNYKQQAYEQYLNTEKLMFPVANKSDQLPNKERVLGVQAGTVFKAYPFSVLSKKKSPVEDKIDGKKLVIYFDKESHSVSVETEAEDITFFTLFWFAWYAFHPETEIFK